jgi:hypothetical protein
VTLEGVTDCRPAESAAEVERMMKVQELILKAMAGTLKWWEAAEIIGVIDRTMRRWRERYQEHGYEGALRLPEEASEPENGFRPRRWKTCCTFTESSISI